MNKFSLLECTLRDGGYITEWNFKDSMIIDTIDKLIQSRLDYVEVGYLNNAVCKNNTTQFNNIEQIEKFLPKDRKDSVLLAMADVQQFLPENLTPYTGKSIDGIRVVFYKHQIEEAMKMGKAVKENGYKLFMQPMVTIDYTVDEYMELAERICALNPDAVSIVDSFGYMIKEDFKKYFRILDNILPSEVSIGFHSHNNMNLALITAQDILEYNTSRHILIDSSLYGMGRGAGNLQTELIANYYNILFGTKYNMSIIIDLISEYILPIFEEKTWGYSPYFMITALYHCHPNYVSYLLSEHKVSVAEFRKYIETIPTEMYTKCKKPYVLEMYDKFLNKNES